MIFVFTYQLICWLALSLFLSKKATAFLRPTEIVKADRRAMITKARRGETCSSACDRAKLSCRVLQLEFANNCTVLRALFPCERGCLHQIGQELPAYVASSVSQEYTSGQCLVRDIADALSCKTSHPKTQRACVCMPQQLVWGGGRNKRVGRGKRIITADGVAHGV